MWYGEDDLFDPEDWGLYMLSRTAQERRGYCVPREPCMTYTTRKKKPMTLREIQAKVAEYSNRKDEKIYENCDLMNPRIILRRTSTTSSQKSQQERICPDTSYDYIWTPSPRTSLRRSERSFDCEYLDLFDLVHFERISIHYQATHNLSALPDRCSNFWRHHESCIWHLKCSFFRSLSSLSPIDGNKHPPVEFGMFSHFFECYRDRFYWAFRAMASSSRWRLSTDHKCNDLRFLRCITRDKANFDISKLEVELVKFSKSAEGFDEPLKLIKEMWRARVIQQFAIISRIGPNDFDTAEKTLVKEMNRSLRVLLDGKTKTHVRETNASQTTLKCVHGDGPQGRLEARKCKGRHLHKSLSQQVSIQSTLTAPSIHRLPFKFPSNISIDDAANSAKLFAFLNLWRGNRGLLQVTIEMDTSHFGSRIKREKKVHLETLVDWAQLGLSLAETNLRLTNYVNANSMKGLKGIKRGSHSSRLSSHEIIVTCLEMIKKELPPTHMASLYTLAHDGMHVQAVRNESRMAFIDDPEYFHTAFKKIVDGGRQLELLVLDDEALDNHYLQKRFKRRTIIDFTHAPIDENSRDQRSEGQASSQSEATGDNLYVCVRVPLCFMTRWPRCYMEFQPPKLEELPEVYATKSTTVIKTSQVASEPGEIVYCHIIGVLEVIKRCARDVGNDDEEDGGNDVNTCTCPDLNVLFTELEILKFKKIASTTAAVLSNCNLFGNLRKKVLQMQITSEFFESIKTASPAEVIELKDYMIRNQTAISRILPKLQLPEFTKGVQMEKMMRTALIAGMFENLFMRGEDAFQIPRERILRFVIAVRKSNFRKNPHHNYHQTFDMAQLAYIFLLRFADKFEPMEKLAFFLAMTCSNLGHMGLTNTGLLTPLSSLCTVFPKPYLQNLAFRICLNILDGSNTLLASFKGPRSKNLLRYIKALILNTDGAKFAEEFRRFDVHHGIDWKDEIHRLEILKCVAVVLSKSYLIRPVAYALNAIMRHVMVEYCEQGFREKENGYPIPPVLDAECHGEWPKMWIKFYKRKVLPVAEFLSKIDPSFSFLDNPIKTLVKRVEEKEKEIIAQLKFFYTSGVYSYYSEKNC